MYNYAVIRLTNHTILNGIENDATVLFQPEFIVRLVPLG